MKQSKSFLTRCLALALALLLAVSCANAGLVSKVFAAENAVGLGEILANNYALTDAEKALLTSGYLVEDEIAYDPFEKTVEIDQENKLVDGGNGVWAPVSAYIEDGDYREELTKEHGQGDVVYWKYNYDGKSFSATVNYEFNWFVASAQQLPLLNAAKNLNADLAEMADVYACIEKNIDILVLAMPKFVELANDGIMGVFHMGEEGKEAIHALNAQLEKNEGTLDIQNLGELYNSSSKSAFLYAKAAEYEAAIEEFFNNIYAIRYDSLVNAEAFNMALSEMFTVGWAAVKTSLDNMTEGEGIVRDKTGAVVSVEKDSPLKLLATEWAAWDASLIKADANFADLDAKLAAVTSYTEVEIDETPVIARKSATASVSMSKVAVKVIWNEFVGQVDGAVEGNYQATESQTYVATLKNGISAEEAAAEISNRGIEAAVIAAFGFDPAHYDRTATALPDELNGDVEYIITYMPKMYNVNYAGEARKLPYGYKLTLEPNADPEKSYDYKVNNKAYDQGAVIVITGDTEITRTSGSAYNLDTYYNKLTEYGNDAFDDILLSGALKGNENIKFRKPGNNVLALDKELLTAEANVASYYENLVWVPYTYGEMGTEYSFSGNTAPWDKDIRVNAQYILYLTNFTEEQINGTLNAVASLKGDAASQISALENLYAYYGDLSMLTKSILAGLNGVIGAADMTPGDGTDLDAKNIELRAFFSEKLDFLIDNNLDANTRKLMIVTILDNYVDAKELPGGGLLYYYRNHEMVKKEVSDLGVVLRSMCETQEKRTALEILATEAGEQYAKYVDKIARLGDKITEINNALTAPNAIIDLESDNLGALTALLCNGEEATYAVNKPLYILSDVLTAVDESFDTYTVGATVTYNGKEESVNVVVIEGEKFNLAELQAEINEAVKNIGIVDAVKDLYNVTVTGDDLAAIDGVEIDQNYSVAYAYSPITYTVKYSGLDVASATVSVDNRSVKFPKPANEAAEKYFFTIGAKEVSAAEHTFTPDELRTLFVNNELTINVRILDVVQDNFEEQVDTLVQAGKDGGYTVTPVWDGEELKALHVELTDVGSVMSFATSFMKTDYTYVGIAGDALMCVNPENNELEISAQTLIDAILNDKEFGSEKLITIGTDGHGKILTSTMQFGYDNNVNARSYVSPFTVQCDCDLVITLNSLPDDFITLTKALKRVRNYMTFESKDGTLNVNLNLPEKLYEAYLVAMLMSGDLDISDPNAFNHVIAYNFFNDYLAIVMDEDVTAETLQNTFDKLDAAANKWLEKDLKDRNISAREDLFNSLKNAIDQNSATKNITIEAIAEKCEIFVKGNMRKALEKAQNAGLIDLSAYAIELGMIKEYKDNGSDLSMPIVAAVTNINEMKFEAAIIDVRNDSKKQKIDFTEDLQATVDALTGEAAIVLLKDVEANLTFNDLTVIDLNGKKLTGNITANRRTVIMDSVLADNKAGEVTGELKGVISLLGGKFNTKYASLVNSGYKMDDNGYVGNAAFSKTLKDGVLNYNINTTAILDEIDSYTYFAASLAAEVALDILMNYYTAGALYVNEYQIYDVDFDDLIKLITTSSTPTMLANEILEVVSLKDLSLLINEITAELLDLEALANAVRNGDEIVSYKIETQPWELVFQHVEDGNYLTGGIASNEAKAKKITVSLSVTGAGTEKVAKALEFMRTIVLDETSFKFVDVEDLYIENRHLQVTGGVEAKAVIDLSDYTTFMAIIMANGTTGQKQQALIDAVNSGKQDDLKKAMDVLSVKDVFNALKELQRNDDFASIAKDLEMNVNINLGDKKEMVEKVLIAGLAAAGKALEKLEIEGVANTLGGLASSEYGWYQIAGDASRSGDVDYRSVGIDYEVTIVDLLLKVKLFDEETDEPDEPTVPDEPEKYLLGDLNFDDQVTEADATMLYRYYFLEDSELCEFNNIRKAVSDINQNGYIDGADVQMLWSYTYVGDEDLDWEPYFIDVPQN